MAHYRIYRLDAAGRITGAGLDAVCPDDRAARALARRLLKAERPADTRDGAGAQPTAAVVVEVNGQRASAWCRAPQAPTWGHADLFRPDADPDAVGERA